MSWDKAKRVHHFDDISTLQEQELLEDAVHKLNKKATTFWVSVFFLVILKKKKLLVDLSTYLAEELNSTLQIF